ncbi:MAG: hypothetical protein NW216_02025 [Hyphomicrobium sp.]|nr:hypothetical protein [Hyphomicrobium sp.]
MRWRLVLAGFAWFLVQGASQSSTLAGSTDPKVPYVTTRAGTVVVLVTTGLDYTAPRIAEALARDGEGELIGWDFVDADPRPYAAGAESDPLHVGGNGTQIAARLISAGSNAGNPASILVAPVRIDSSDDLGLAKAIAFASRTPAKAIVVALRRPPERPWAALAETAARIPDITIVLPDCKTSPVPADQPRPASPNVVPAGAPETAGRFTGAPIEAAMRELAQAVCP